MKSPEKAKIMLEGLDKIDWKAIRGTEVPELLQLLATGEIDNYLWSELHNAVNPQGTVFEVTKIVVPFFFQLLGTSDLRVLRIALGELDAIAGNCFINYEDTLDLFETENFYIDRDEFFGGVQPIRLLKENKIHIETYQTILKGVKYYRKILQHPDIGIQRQALMLLAKLCYDYPSFYKDAMQIVNTTVDAYLKAEAIYYTLKMAHFATYREAKKRRYVIHDSILQAWLDDTQSRVIPLATAMILGLNARMYDRFIDRIIPILTAAYLHPVTYESYLDVDQYYLNFNVLHVLKDIGNSGNYTGLKTVFLSSQLGAKETQIVGFVLLDLVFSQRKGRNRMPDPPFYRKDQPLNNRQSDILQLLVDNKVFWELPTDDLSFFYGLPDSREELRALIEKS